MCAMHTGPKGEGPTACNGDLIQKAETAPVIGH